MTVQTSPPVVLPTTKSEIDKRWVSQKIVVLGSPKIGKSSFFSFGDKTLYIQTEQGLNHLSVMKLPVRSWDEFKNVYSALLKAKNDGKFPYDTIVIDTIDSLVDLANEDVVERGRQKFKSADINVVGDIPNGAGWMWSTENINLALSKLETLGACIVLIGHLDRKEIKQPNNVSMHLQTISIGGKTGRAIMAYADHILSIEVSMKGSEMVRRVRTRPTATVEAGSRGEMIPEDWVWSSDMKADYTKFRGLFQ